MALSNRLKLSHGDLFGHGAYLIGDVEPVRDFDKSSPGKAVQAVDKESGLLVWSVSVLDADPDARKDMKTVTVKISAPHQPVPPEAMPGVPFRPVEFDGLTVTPYLDDKRNRVAFSFRATGMRAPHVGGKPAPRAQNSEAA
ncbi:MAG: plasmid replication, integration and excision activator [Pseudonocardia sp.]|uniref:plasmid replication, integration and excision activator n=1 Tax=Pseudonocardia sp. TaxID=60912 RepID=UPI001AD14737|nr:plasmid replication, integration and excision activator [Pseudonocardia sp.]MBN9101131.1 plasmid replication, integration and excision activator [Pseudonocardia sp.]